MSWIPMVLGDAEVELYGSVVEQVTGAASIYTKMQQGQAWKPRPGYRIAQLGCAIPPSSKYPPVVGYNCRTQKLYILDICASNVRV